MKASELIEVLTHNGGVLRVEEGQLVFDGSAAALERYRQAIAELRPELVDLLSPCKCETAGGWLYRCELHQETPSGRCLVEPAPDAPTNDLVELASGLFGGGAWEARR